MTTVSDPLPFRYPQAVLKRRHGPAGYADYAAYRPWLRDDFTFRCVYCLIREQWGRVTGEFDVDHFVPQIQSPDQVADYGNLLYACHSCNLRRGQRQLPDPAAALNAATIRVRHDGRIETFSSEAARIVRILSLNSDRWIQWRRMWIRIIAMAERFDPALLQDLLRYPEDMPDLSKSCAPENSKPERLKQSCFARNQRGELPATYV